MGKTAIIYGSTTGTTEDIAGRIASKLNIAQGDIYEISKVTADTVAGYDTLLLGSSTWGSGDLQDDWYDGVKAVKAANLNGKTVAIFGCGDSEGYSDTFCGGMGELYNAAKEAGAKVIGKVSTDGYTYDDSEAVVDGQFVGLALDEVNEDDKTDERIDAWVAAIKPEL